MTDSTAGSSYGDDMRGDALLAAEAWETYRAFADRIVPPDDYPGAWDAGAGDFLALQLAGDLAHLTDRVASALGALEAAARRRSGARYAVLDPATQDAVIVSLETSTDEHDRSGVTLLIGLTLEGYYANPENGGNHGEASWKMIGYTRRPGRPLRRAESGA